MSPNRHVAPTTSTSAGNPSRILSREHNVLCIVPSRPQHDRSHRPDGFNLRSLILGVPPVLPALRDDLHLSFTTAGALTALPVLGLGAASIPGAVLVSRFGASFVISAGTLGLGLAALLRLAPPVPVALYVFTGLMSLFVAIVQP